MMGRMRLACFCLLLPVLLSAAEPIPLFNGTDLEGWAVKAKPEDVAKGFWSVRDGLITCDSRGRKDHDYVWLVYTAREFDDFTLCLKVRSYLESTGNSGVQIRSRYDDEARWLDGPQVDLHPPAPWRSGLIYDETRGTQRWVYPSLPDWKILPEQGPRQWTWRHASEGSGWNDVEIRCEGSRIVTRVNGHIIADFDGAGILDDEAHRSRKVGRRGYIALQLHSKDETHIQFRDIEVVPGSGGWTSLFDGRSTSGWEEVTGAPFPSTWLIENGCLKAVPNQDGTQDIRTKRSFHSFELEWEWKMAPAGNSGVKYLVHKIDRWTSKTGKGYQARARGLEYQLADDAENPDARSKDLSRSGGLYGVYAPLSQAAKSPGEFNRSRLLVDRGHVEHWLNGVKTADFDLGQLDTKRFPTRGVFASPISLQNHNSETWFRNIRIRELE